MFSYGNLWHIKTDLQALYIKSVHVCMLVTKIKVLVMDENVELCFFMNDPKVENLSVIVSTILGILSFM